MTCPDFLTFCPVDMAREWISLDQDQNCQRWNFKKIASWRFDILGRFLSTANDIWDVTPFSSKLCGTKKPPNFALGSRVQLVPWKLNEMKCFFSKYASISNKEKIHRSFVCDFGRDGGEYGRADRRDVPPKIKSIARPNFQIKICKESEKVSLRTKCCH